MEPELLTRLTPAEAVRYIIDDNYAVEEKRDGERLLVECNGQQLDAWNKKGERTVVFPSLRRVLTSTNVTRFILDGEDESPSYQCWDLLRAEDYDLTSLPYFQRREVLKVFAACPNVIVIPMWLGFQNKWQAILDLWARRAEGVVFKNLHAPHRPGRAKQHFKLKFEKTATVRIREVDSERDRAEIEMLDQHGWHSVSGLKVRNGSVRKGDFVEVRYLSASAKRRLQQPVFLRPRRDVNDSDCSMEQLEYHGRWAEENIIEILRKELSRRGLLA